MHCNSPRILKLALAFLLALPLAAQTPPDLTLGAAIRNLASRSGVVLVGQVVRIARSGGVVEITLRVDQPVLNSTGSPSSTYTLREWAGLWPPGQNRYTLGQRALFFLHAPSAAGLSSPVDGMEGIVPLLVASGAPPLLDVRRLNARLLREPNSPLLQPEAGAIAVSEAVTLVLRWRHPAGPEPTPRPLPIAYRPAPPSPGSAAPLNHEVPRAY